MKAVRIAIVLMMLSTTASLFAQGDLNTWLAQIQSTDPAMRQAGFYSIEKAHVTATNDQVKLALVNLLIEEESYIKAQAALDNDIPDSYSAYFSDVVVAVSALRDVRSIDALVGVIGTGNAVGDALASFGVSSVDKVIASLNTTDNVVKCFSALILGKMLDANTVTDATSIAKMRAALESASMDPDYFTGLAGLTGLLKLFHIPVSELPARVQIDIKPGGYPNAINPGAHGVIPVALLSTTTFDARTVDPETARFGPGQALPANGAHVEDVNGDGLPDVVFQFSTPVSNIDCSDTASFLVGKTLSGQAIIGSDSVVTVGCK